MGECGERVWDETLLRDPHAAADKRLRVQKMFSAIAPSYDLNNRLHSLWLDQHWRGRAVELAGVKPTDVVIDVACGTGDLAMKFAARAQRVIGIDFTLAMLPIAQEKATRGNAHGLLYVNGDAIALPLADASADVVSIAFGIRNVADPQAALREFRRVLRPGGRAAILEFSLPANPLLRRLYNFYFRQILPRTATLISRDRTGAYRYLPESVNTFISREQMVDMMTVAGFTAPRQHPLTAGICVCYTGQVA